MSYGYLDFKIRDLELAAYDLAEHFTKQGYQCRVNSCANGYLCEVYKERFFKNIIGTPSVVKALFFNEENSVIEVKIGKMYKGPLDVVKETLLVATIIPGVSKTIQLINLEKEVKKQALKVAYKYKEKK